MFADIAGFTAWSSEREPSQVFKLLETLYHEFDIVAARLKVFKVETIGDCYVAVAGLPAPDKDHAKTMVRFAHKILTITNELTEQLESVLGPGTSDLGLRVGLHSGPVTAGVLRGAKSRFQLFGDTMNTASRIESTGEVGKIQVSEATGELICQAGKQHWLTKRNGKITAKGKGELQVCLITSLCVCALYLMFR
jgi:class 3 adenylate cyclase